MKFVSRTDLDIRLSPISGTNSSCPGIDSALKHATFVLNRYSSEENNNECKPETSRNSPNCFDILMKAQLKCTKLPQLLNEDAPRFTGLF